MSREKVIADFESGGEQLQALITGLSADQLTARPVAGTWSIHEIVVHLMDSDAIGIDRMKRIIAEELPLLIGYNETKFIERLHPHDQPVGDAIAQFSRARRLFAITLRTLSEADFNRAGIHNEIGKKTLGDMLKTYVEHLNHHLTFIAKKRAMVLTDASAPKLASENDQKLLTDYENAPKAVRAAIAGLSPEQMRAVPVPGKWSLQQLIIHLADADIAFAHRLKRIIAEDKPTYAAWDQDKFIERLAYNDQSAEDAVQTIEVTHRQLVRVLNTVGLGVLDRPGTHNERGPQTGRSVLEYAVFHIAHHLKFVSDKRRALGLPVS